MYTRTIAVAPHRTLRFMSRSSPPHEARARERIGRARRREAFFANQATKDNFSRQSAFGAATITIVTRGVTIARNASYAIRLGSVFYFLAGFAMDPDSVCSPENLENSATTQFLLPLATGLEIVIHHCSVPISSRATATIAPCKNQPIVNLRDFSCPRSTPTNTIHCKTR